MSLSEDAAEAMATKTGLHIEAMRDDLAAVLPDGRTIAQVLDEVERFGASRPEVQLVAVRRRIIAADDVD